MDNEFFYYSIQTKVLRNKSNLIESFKLSSILNSLKFSNYLIQTHSKEMCLDCRHSSYPWYVWRDLD